jgi:tetratricopeptide (TPR) repeat protein
MNIQDPSLDRYRQLIDDLKQRKQPIDSQQAFEILTARDALQIALEQQKPVPIDVLDEVIKLDTRFRANAIRLTAAINKNSRGELVRWRESINPSVQAWWWRLESIESPPEKYPSDLFLKTVGFGAWVMNINLLLNIASRFGGAGGVGFFDPLQVIIPAIGTLLSAGNKIPTFGSILKQLNIPNSNRETTKFFATVAVYLALTVVSYIPPDLSKWANINGLDKFNDGDFIGAEKDYKKSISLNGGNIDAHYNLGNLYEEWLDTENAKKQYKMAIVHKSPEDYDGFFKAYNNLGRLYIKEKKYSEAAFLLETGLGVAKKNTSLPATKYSIYKNLGWARLEQKRYAEAKVALEQAIYISGNPANEKLIHNPGAAHCLLAQTLEQLKQPQAATIEWQQCSQLPPQPDKFDPDEDIWHYLATQKLANQKTPKEPNAKLPKVK